MDRIEYELLNYNRYLNRLSDIERNEYLIGLDIRKNVLGYTKYGYELDEYLVGNGDKDLFIVGGTHGSEIISVDFVTQLMNNIELLDNYNPNEVTLHFIPNQNPEGFNITTEALKKVNTFNFEGESKDYYIRYRLDNLLNSYLNRINIRLKFVDGVIDHNKYLEVLKESFMFAEWKNLCDEQKGVKELRILEKFIKAIENVKNFADLYSLINNVIDKMKKVVSNPYFEIVIDRLNLSLFSDELLYDINSHNIIEINKSVGKRLYQDFISNPDISNTYNKNLGSKIDSDFTKYNINKGSLIKFDPNGDYVNLNKNNINNKGIIRIGGSPSNNIMDNTVGPIGINTADKDNFEYAFENKVLLDLLNISNARCRLCGVILYHGTGGLVYSKPYDKESRYNELLSESYIEKSSYKKVEKSENTGFGDYLRSNYPGVLLIELSKMGGNPIAPYGDYNNFNNVINDNIKAIDNLLLTIKEIDKNSL